MYNLIKELYINIHTKAYKPHLIQCISNKVIPFIKEQRTYMKTTVCALTAVFCFDMFFGFAKF